MTEERIKSLINEALVPLEKEIAEIRNILIALSRKFEEHAASDPSNWGLR